MALYRWDTKVSWIWQSFNPENTGTEWQVLTKTCSWYAYCDVSSWWGWDELIQSHEWCWVSWTIERPSWATYAIIQQYNCWTWCFCYWDWNSLYMTPTSNLKCWQSIYACNTNWCLCYWGCHCHDINFFWPTYSWVTPWEIEFLIVGWGWGWGAAFKSNTMYYSWWGWWAWWFIEDTAFVKSWVYNITVWAWWYWSWCPSIAFWCVAYWWWYWWTWNGYGSYGWCSWGSWGWWFWYTYNWYSCNWWAWGSWCSWQWYKWWNWDCATAWAWGWGWAGWAWECWNTWTWWLWKCSCISWELQWYAWGWGWAPYWCWSCWWWNSTAKSSWEWCPATTCWSWWGWIYSNSNTSSPCWWAWANWIVIVRYKTNWCHIKWANWGCKYVCWEYTIHCFTSNWNFEVFTG